MSPEILFPRIGYLTVPIVCLRRMGFYRVDYDLRGQDIPATKHLHKTELRTLKSWIRFCCANES